jgi:hypothetical protein
MSNILSRASILAAEDLPRETVAVPEWGGDVLVQGLTARERDDFEISLSTGKGKSQENNFRNLRARLVARCVVDEKGERIFGDADMTALGGKSAVVLQRLFEMAQKLSGFTSADVDELTKNSDDGQSEDSPSA